jgi:hypothetical protein
MSASRELANAIGLKADIGAQNGGGPAAGHRSERRRRPHIFNRTRLHQGVFLLPNTPYSQFVEALNE